MKKPTKHSADSLEARDIDEITQLFLWRGCFSTPCTTGNVTEVTGPRDFVGFGSHLLKCMSFIKASKCIYHFVLIRSNVAHIVINVIVCRVQMAQIPLSYIITEGRKV